MAFPTPSPLAIAAAALLPLLAWRVLALMTIPSLQEKAVRDQVERRKPDRPSATFPAGQVRRG